MQLLTHLKAMFTPGAALALIQPTRVCVIKRDLTPQPYDRNLLNCSRTMTCGSVALRRPMVCPFCDKPRRIFRKGACLKCTETTQNSVAQSLRGKEPR